MDTICPIQGCTQKSHVINEENVFLCPDHYARFLVATKECRSFTLMMLLESLPGWRGSQNQSARSKVVKKSGTRNESLPPEGLVGVEACMEIVFPNEEDRPCLRTFRDMQKKRLIPYRKMGRMTYFDALEVRRALDRQFTIHPREEDPPRPKRRSSPKRAAPEGS